MGKFHACMQIIKLCSVIIVYILQHFLQLFMLGYIPSWYKINGQLTVANMESQLDNFL